MRNVHYIQLGNAKKEKDQTGMLLLARHLIEAIVPQEKGSLVLMNSGVAYEVVESADEIKKKLNTNGLFQVI